MPRQLKEIKNFNLGTILNLSEKDIPIDAAAYSLNVDPMSENGILNSVNNDRIFLSTNNTLITSTPISWNNSSNSQQGSFKTANSSGIFQDIGIFNEQASSRISFIGTKGIRENLIVDNVQPWYENIAVSTTLASTTIYAAEAETASTSQVILTIYDGSGAAPFSTTAELENVILGKRVFKSDGTFFGICTTVNSTTSITFFGGLNYAIADNDVLYTALDATFVPSAAISLTDDNFSYLTNTNTITKVGLADSDITVSGFTNNGTATITLLDATRTNYDDGDASDYFTITTPDGRIKNYHFSDAHNESQTGTVVTINSIVGVAIGMSDGTASVTAIATNVKNAIEHANGHGRRISITQASGVLTLTYVHEPLDIYLAVGSYISLSTGVYSNNEIIKITSIDTTNNKIYIKRGCFGTTTSTYATTSSYNIYSNRMTIDGKQSIVTKGVGNVDNWSSYSGNHLGGNSHYLRHCTNAGAEETEGGKIITSTSNQSITFSASAKTVTFGSAISDIPFEEGETITFYHSTDSAVNNGFSAKILKKATSPCVLTLDTAPTDTNALSSDSIYIEANLLKNHTLHHAVDTPTQTVDASGKYKINDWEHTCYDEFASGYVSNLYGYNASNQDNANVVVDNDGGGYWETSPGNVNLSGATDRAETQYPFEANDRFIKIIADYLLAGTLTTSVALTASSTDNIIYASATAADMIAANDILLIGSEYMKVLSIDGKNITVERGFFDSTLGSPSASTAISKSVNHGIKQSVAKERLKAGQSYTLSFYAQDADQGSFGAVSIKFNGGYIQGNGHWTEASRDLTLGYGSTINDVMQEHRWIPFEGLSKPNNDASATSGGLDDIWRKFSLTFYCPKGVAFSTDMDIEFICRATDGKFMYLDLVDLSENNMIYCSNETSLFKTSSFIDNNGVKDLVSYDSKHNILKVVPEVFQDLYRPNAPIESFSMSSTAIRNITSSIDNATIVANNREVHIGFGGKKEDTSPQWLGYVNHTVFGEDYSDKLYLDEDTVHSYDEAGAGSMSKICLAGEHERITVSWSSPNLTVTHVEHSMNIGDNIIIREWMDTDNSWDGNGVWIVKTKPDDDSFTCVRAITYDSNPSGGPSNNLISYRPYFYYGIKHGEPYIYRIFPDAKLGGGGTDDDSLNALSTTYTKGKIEKSLPLDVGASSITTCYNKVSAGTGGGRVYILSSTTDEIYSYDVQIKYDEWNTSPLVKKASMDLEFKAFKWSNDHINGNIGGTTEVFGGLAELSTPNIQYAGILSDIIETKGTSHTFDTDETANNGITCAMFDTRLWIQCRPVGESGFTESDRFLFCTRTEDGNTDGNDVLYCADRTPPTTVVDGVLARYSWHMHNTYNQQFTAGPGKSGEAGTAEDKRAYFYSYDSDLGEPAITRIATYRKAGAINNYSNNDSTLTGGNLSLHYVHKIGYVNFGYNVGWTESPSIQVARHGLFQIADNDGDGILDGTGVVVSNDKSITDTTNLTGPYGKLHQRVCSHAVGLIGGTETKWQRHWGRLHAYAEEPFQYIGTRGVLYVDGPAEDAPEQMDANKVIFIATDMHYGDDQPEEKFTFNDKADESTNETKLRLNSSNGATGLTVGDTIFIDGAGVDSATVITEIDLLDSDDAFSGTPDVITVAVPYASFSSGSGNIWPHAIHKTYGEIVSFGGVIDDQIMFHYSYDEEIPENGSVFNQGIGGGHYTKTYFTPPSYYGGLKTSDASKKRVRPGYVWPIEKLSFRGGVMMRPFEMDDDGFNDLIIGRGLHIDMPAWPNPVYHVANSSNLHYDVGNNSPNNSFASKLFITSPISNDLSQRSKVYICDLNFMYPDESSQIVQEMEGQVGDGIDTNAWNADQSNTEAGPSWDICFSGDIGAYDVTNAASILEGNNADQPMVTLDVSTFTGHNSEPNLFATTGNSNYRDMVNALHGLCLSVMDATTGTIQTRYIIGSKDGGTDVDVKVHYPFGHPPAAGDKFWVWKHSSVATAPIRLMKATTLRGGLGDALDGDPILTKPVYKNGGTVSVTSGTVTTGENHNLTTGDKIEIYGTSAFNDIHSITVTGPKIFTASDTISGGTADTGNWRLLSDSDSSVANPLTVSLVKPTLLTTFGGLDMRKIKSYDVSAIIDDTANITLTSTSHLLFDGNTVSLKSEMITAENDRTFTSASNWVEYSPSGTAPTFSDDGSPANLVITNIADTNAQGATLATGSLETTVDDRVYRITAELWTDSGTLTNVSMGIGGTTSSTFSITTDKIYYIKEVEAGSDAALIISSTHNGAITWNIDNVTVEDVAQNAIYIVENKTANTIDTANPDFIDLVGTLHTNQWEMLIAGTSGGSEMGELRAGLASWDKGNIAANVQRYDSTTDIDRFMAFGESSVLITPTALPDQPGDFFLKNTRYDYKISFIYDGYQEGPLSDSYWSFEDTSTRNKLEITILVKEYSRRLSHVCLYRRNNQNDFYKLVEQISVKGGWNTFEGGYSYSVGDEGQLGATYESRTGMSEILDTVKLKYGISTEIDGYLFAGDCAHSEIKNASNMVFRSRPGMFSMFDYVNDFLTLKSKPTALANFNGRLYAFDQKNIYTINQQSLAIESIYEGVGCINKDSVIVTEYGMFFADKNGAYLHSGQAPVKISETIHKGGSTEVAFGGTDNIRDVSWENTITNVVDAYPYVIYDPNTSSVLFNIEYLDIAPASTTNLTLSKRRQYVWSFSIQKKRWDLWELSEDDEIGKPFLGNSGEVYYPIGDAIYEHRGGSSKRDYTWISKKLTMGEDSILKVFNKVKMNGLSQDINLGGDNIESSDRLLVTTSTGNISSSDITSSVVATGFIDYKLSGSNKRGRWIQIKAENMTEPLDSIGFIFRRKSTK